MPLLPQSQNWREEQGQLPGNTGLKLKASVRNTPFQPQSRREEIFENFSPDQ